ncbi:MAG: hypothetical protein L3J47_00615 [Sulfurovum sp.]|nr:hypothetical protein [Sulfurovum sp.]
MKNKDDKLEYDLEGSVTVSVYCTVEARSLKEALEKAKELPLIDLCFSCGGGYPTEEWITSGDLDGEVVDQRLEVKRWIQV